MRVVLRINPDTCYGLAEKRAAYYFDSLKEQVSQKTYVSSLTKDIETWKHNHIRQYSWFSLFSGGKGKTSPTGYHNYIKWLDYTGKLENYLDRSISYIYMRDLGKSLNSPQTQLRVKQVVDHLKDQLTSDKDSGSGSVTNDFSMAGLFRWGQKEGIEETVIWMMNKLKTVADHIPAGMDAEHAQRKLIKIMAGVVMHVLEEMAEGISAKERAKKLDEAIRLGYSYGLTYPFIDDLLDANVLSDKEKQQYSELIRTTLITGSVPELGSWPEDKVSLMRYIHSELRDAYEYIKAHQRPDTRTNFFEQSYVFFQSQEVDRQKDLSNTDYTNEELFIPIILKSSSSRLIVRSVISASEDQGFDSRTFYYGIYNQLADDFADMFDDMKNGAVTPYTYFLKYHKQRPDLINPFELYWTVISNLIHNVYQSNRKTSEVILDRAINGLKRFKERMGAVKYKEVMELFASSHQPFFRMIQKMVDKADDVDFFDKLLRDHIMTNLKNEREEQKEFVDTIERVRNEINSTLSIAKTEKDSVINGSILDAANYSLMNDGKRLRPIMAWVMGVNEYGLNSSAITPLLRALEYMHTASLIFDDLPSQDNANLRRGNLTLHQIYNVATAELTGLFLTQRAIEEQASLDEFDAKTVLRLIKYSSQMTADMCKGQEMDLNSKGKKLSLERLNLMSFYKTGLAFEASLMMPAILAKVDEQELAGLKKYAYHAGIAFQIKDDLLDVEGEQSLLGKTVGKDAENNHTTFVSILGVEGARIAMWEHYCLAMDVLEDFPRNTPFLKHLLNYIVNRDH
ncbi:polyprenyl synthetase family protein [Pseudoneobacillus sp. C159]